MATPGECSRNCDTKLIIFLVVLFFVIAMEALCITPATILLLKLVDKPLQPFGLGVMRCANILIAYIPAPIVLSQAIDSTCVLWNDKCSGNVSQCHTFTSKKKLGLNFNQTKHQKYVFFYPNTNYQCFDYLVKFYNLVFNRFL